ncbi:MAG: metallophosphoesterase [Meiothermus sp.]|nr:metallophosphoesterase [Meiothermus sp.]
MSQVLTFVHLTDLHITDPAQPDDHLHSDTATTLEMVKARIAKLEPKPDFILVSGDLTNHGSPESFKALKGHLDGLPAPVLLALGNHDKRGPFHQVMRDQSSEAPYFYSQSFGHLKVIVLDSSAPAKVDGSIEPEQFEWLEAELAQDPTQPKIIVIHHPPCRINLSIFDHITFRPEDAARLGDLLQGQNVLGIFSGHVHFDRFALWNGIPCVIGAGLHNLTDVTNNDGIRATSGGSFNLCRVEGHDLTVTIVPLASGQEELHHIGMDVLRKYMDKLESQAAD